MSPFADQFPRPVVTEGAMRAPLPAAAVWSLVGDLNGEGLAEGMVERVEVVGEGAGAIRTLHLPGGAGRVVERIEEYDAEELYYIYRVIDSGPVDLTNYLGLVKVQPAGPDACIVSWTSMCQAVDGKSDEIRAILRGNIDVVFAAIRKHFGFA
jgi:hypothetical protein